MDKPKKEPKRAINFFLEEKYIRQLDELGEALIRPNKSDVIRFLIADAAKKILEQKSTIGLETVPTPRAKRAAANNQ